MKKEYAKCIDCKYSFTRPDVDESGKKLKCPKCGSTRRNYTLEVQDVVHVTSISHVNLQPKVHSDHDFEVVFDTDQNFNGRTIVECSGMVGKSLVQFFNKYPQELKVLNRRKFEVLIAELFYGFGYEVELTKQTRDGGKDIIAIKRSEVDVKYLIECKRPDPGNYVGIAPVRELYGVRMSERATKAILATTTHFSEDAKNFSEKHTWELELRAYNDIVKWIKEYASLHGL